MTGIVYTCLHTNQSRSYLNHLVYTLKYMHMFLKKCLNWQYNNKMVKYIGMETYIEVEIVVI